MSYKDTYNKFKITHELLVNRYMLSVILSNQYNLIEALQARERAYNKLLDKTTVSKLKKEKHIVDTIEFNNFVLPSKQYQALLNEYGAEVVTNACVILDKYIQTSGVVLKQPYKKLKEWAINLAMREKLSDYTSTITQAITSMDYRVIEDKDMAIKYIAGTPIHMRNIDEGCKYLKEKFNL